MLVAAEPAGLRRHPLLEVLVELRERYDSVVVQVRASGESAEQVVSEEAVAEIG
jgi:hypothetical protein